MIPSEPGGESDDFFEAIGPGSAAGDTPSSERPNTQPSPDADSSAPDGQAIEDSDDDFFFAAIEASPEREDLAPSGGSLVAGGGGPVNPGWLLNELRTVEEALDEVPECCGPLIRLLDRFEEATPENFQIAVTAFAKRALQYLDDWGGPPSDLERRRFERLQSTGTTETEIHDAIVDLKVSAAHLARVRPEDFLDMGTWRLYRDVRACVSTNDIRTLADTLQRLDAAIEHNPDHLLGHYKPRLHERYGKLVEAEIQRVAPLLDLEPAGSTPEQLADALMQLDRGAKVIDELARLYPHPLLDDYRSRFDARRQQWLPALEDYGEHAIRDADLARIIRAIGAYDRLEPESYSGRSLASLAVQLTQERDRLLAEIQAQMTAALQAGTPGPAWSALRRLDAVPPSLRPPGSQMQIDGDKLQVQHDRGVAGLERRADELLLKGTAADAEKIQPLIDDIVAYLGHNPDHPLARRVDELRALRDRLLHQLNESDRIRRAFEEMQARAKRMLADPDKASDDVRGLADEFRADTIVPTDMKQPLIDALDTRADRLRALDRAGQASLVDEVSAHIAVAEKGLTADDRRVIGAKLDAVHRHRTSLSEMLAALEKIRQWEAGLDTAGDPVTTHDAGTEAVTPARVLLNTYQPQHALPGAVPVREELQAAVARAGGVLRDLARLLKLPKMTLSELKFGEHPDPDLGAGAQYLAAEQPDLTKRLALAPDLIGSLHAASRTYGLCAQAAATWDETSGRLQNAIDAKAATVELVKEARALVDGAAAERDSFIATDRWLGANNRLVLWYDSRLKQLADLSAAVAKLADADAARRARFRRRVMIAAVLLLLIASGVFGWMRWENEQRRLRADELLAKVRAARASEELPVIDPPLGESISFLDAGHRDTFAELTTATDDLQDWRNRIAALEAEMAEIIAQANRALESGEEHQPALDRLIEFRDNRALETQKTRLEPVRLDLLAAMAAMEGEPGLTAGTHDEVDDAIAAIHAKIEEFGVPELTDHRIVRDMIGRLETRKHEITADRLRAMCEPALAPGATLELVEETIRELDAELEQQPRPVRQMLAPTRRALLEARDRIKADLREADLQVRLEQLRAIIRRGMEADAIDGARGAMNDVDAALREDPDGPELRRRLGRDLQMLQELIDYLQLIIDLRGRLQGILQGIDGLNLVSNERREIVDAIAAQPVPRGRPRIEEVLAEELARLDRRYEFLRSAVAAEDRASQPAATYRSVMDDYRQLDRAVRERGDKFDQRALEPPLKRLLVRAGVLFNGELDSIVDPALASEDPEFIRGVASQVRELEPTLADLATRERVQLVLEILDRRASWFERRIALQARVQETMGATQTISQARDLDREVGDMRAAQETLVRDVRPPGEFGNPPSLARDIDDGIAILSRRADLLKLARDGLAAVTIPPVQKAIEEIERQLTGPLGEPNANSLAMPLEQLRAWLAMLQAADRGRESTDSATVRGIIEEMDTEIARDRSEPYRTPLRALRGELETHASKISVTLTVEGPSNVIGSETEVTGRAVGDAIPQTIHVLVNGNKRGEAFVGADGRYTARVELDRGHNDVIISADGTTTHPGNARIRIDAQSPRLTLTGPTRVESREAELIGEVHEGELDKVFLFVNGQKRTVNVVDGGFEVTVILLAGENTVIASPVDNPEHNGSATHKIFADIERAAVIVTLTWEPEDADVDLHIVQPNGVRVWYRNKEPGGENGQLDVDMRKQGGPENYSWTVRPGEKMLAGEYIIQLVYYSGDAPDVTCTLNIRWHEGTARERVLDPVTVHLKRSQLKQHVEVHRFRVPE